MPREQYGPLELCVNIQRMMEDERFRLVNIVSSRALNAKSRAPDGGALIRPIFYVFECRGEDGKLRRIAMFLPTKDNDRWETEGYENAISLSFALSAYHDAVDQKTIEKCDFLSVPISTTRMSRRHWLDLFIDMSAEKPIPYLRDPKVGYIGFFYPLVYIRNTVTKILEPSTPSNILTKILKFFAFKTIFIGQQKAWNFIDCGRFYLENSMLAINGALKGQINQYSTKSTVSFKKRAEHQQIINRAKRNPLLFSRDDQLSYRIDKRDQQELIVEVDSETLNSHPCVKGPESQKSKNNRSFKQIIKKCFSWVNKGLPKNHSIKQSKEIQGDQTEESNVVTDLEEEFEKKGMLLPEEVLEILYLAEGQSIESLIESKKEIIQKEGIYSCIFIYDEKQSNWYIYINDEKNKIEERYLFSEYEKDKLLLEKLIKVEQLREAKDANSFGELKELKRELMELVKQPAFSSKGKKKGKEKITGDEESKNGDDEDENVLQQLRDIIGSNNSSSEIQKKDDQFSYTYYSLVIPLTTLGFYLRINARNEQGAVCTVKTLRQYGIEIKTTGVLYRWQSPKLLSQYHQYDIIDLKGLEEEVSSVKVMPLEDSTEEITSKEIICENLSTHSKNESISTPKTFSAPKASIPEALMATLQYKILSTELKNAIKEYKKNALGRAEDRDTTIKQLKRVIEHCDGLLKKKNENSGEELNSCDDSPKKENKNPKQEPDPDPYLILRGAMLYWQGRTVHRHQQGDATIRFFKRHLDRYSRFAEGLFSALYFEKLHPEYKKYDKESIETACNAFKDEMMKMVKLGKVAENLYKKVNKLGQSNLFKNGKTENESASTSPNTEESSQSHSEQVAHTESSDSIAKKPVINTKAKALMEEALMKAYSKEEIYSFKTEEGPTAAA